MATKKGQQIDDSGTDSSMASAKSPGNNKSLVNDYNEKISVQPLAAKNASQTPLAKTGASKMQQSDSNDLAKAASIASQRRVTLAPMSKQATMADRVRKNNRDSNIRALKPMRTAEGVKIYPNDGSGRSASNSPMLERQNNMRHDRDSDSECEVQTCKLN